MEKLIKEEYRKDSFYDMLKNQKSDNYLQDFYDMQKGHNYLQEKRRNEIKKNREYEFDTKVGEKSVKIKKE